MDLDVKMKAVMLGAVFLIVSSELMTLILCVCTTHNPSAHIQTLNCQHPGPVQVDMVGVLLMVYVPHN